MISGRASVAPMRRMMIIKIAVCKGYRRTINRFSKSQPVGLTLLVSHFPNNVYQFAF